MKKTLSFLFVVTIFCLSFTQVKAQSANFNLKMTVNKYIEAMESPVDFNFGTTVHTILKAEELIGATGTWNLAYANCPFSVTISGNNPANQGVPRFAREEIGANGGGVDVLNTVYSINLTSNNRTTSFKTGLFGIGLPIGAREFPKTTNYAEAPHNGQIRMDMTAYVNTAIIGLVDRGTPIRRTLINPDFSNLQSADAGQYTCTMTVTLSAL